MVVDEVSITRFLGTSKTKSAKTLFVRFLSSQWTRARFPYLAICPMCIKSYHRNRCWTNWSARTIRRVDTDSEVSAVRLRHGPYVGWILTVRLVPYAFVSFAMGWKEGRKIRGWLMYPPSAEYLNQFSACRESHSREFRSSSFFNYVVGKLNVDQKEGSEKTDSSSKRL